MTDPDGLIYYPSRYDPPLGHAGFEVRLSNVPSKRYFDARRALFPVEQAGALRLQLVEHPYRPAGDLRFTAGRIRLKAHDGDTQEIVSFGGRLSVTEEDGLIVCRATSTAPFLPLNDDFESPFVFLESELEILLAQQRARWGKDEYRHLDRLGALEPMTLFVASLKTVEERLERLAHVERDDEIRHELHLVRDMRRRLERAGEWPSTALGLDEVL